MKQYHNLLQNILDNGEYRGDERTGAGTIAIFPAMVQFDLSGGQMPIVDTKPVGMKTVSRELDWFKRGEDNITSLVKDNCNIWSSDALRFNLDYVINDAKLFTKEQITAAQQDSKKGNYAPAREILKTFENELKTNPDFAEKAGYVGPGYGPQWRGTHGAEAVDQFKALEDALAAGGASRRMLVSAWNSKQQSKVALPPCHIMYQVDVSPETNKLSLAWYQRSVDTVLGLPFNIASYALLQQEFAEAFGFDLGTLTGFLGNTHVYKPHLPAVQEQLARTPSKELPTIKFNVKKDSALDYKTGDFEIINYNPQPKLENPTPMFGGFF